MDGSIYLNKRVIALEGYEGNSKIVNKIGTVIWVGSRQGKLLIEFDEDIEGHSGESTGRSWKDGHCWWMPVSSIRLCDCKMRVE